MSTHLFIKHLFRKDSQFASILKVIHKKKGKEISENLSTRDVQDKETMKLFMDKKMPLNE